MKILCKASALCALAVLSVFTAYSQAVNGTLLGTVTDSSGAVIPNAKVLINETNTNVSRSGNTNESGNYVFPDVPPGTYSVTIEQTGFKKERRSNIVVEVNTTARVDFSMQPGSISESVEVTG